MVVEIGSEIRIRDASKELYDWAQENLIIPNPQYREKGTQRALGRKYTEVSLALSCGWFRLDRSYRSRKAGKAVPFREGSDICSFS